MSRRRGWGILREAMWTPDEALKSWDGDAVPLPCPDEGLINRTWLVGEPPRRVLQWVNPIVDPRIHDDIVAVTERLEASGMATPRLVPSREGHRWIADPEGGVWRVLTFVPGHTLHRLKTTAQATRAGELVGRFHAALTSSPMSFRAPKRPMHDTPLRMAELEQALAEADQHPLAADARHLGTAILADWRRWHTAHGDLLDLPKRPCHGDLKISNLRFADDDPAGDDPVGDDPVGDCLLDFDTLGAMSWAAEMGDAWRSWCNPAGEDAPDRVRFDVPLFAAGARAWLAAAPPLEADERRALVPTIERICLELSARFCADTVRNSYFREDRERFPEPGAHNLLKARCQHRLAEAARAARADCEAVVVAAPRS